MSRKKTRLELTWIGKEERPKLEPRILLENPEKSYHASVRRPDDFFDNTLIHGDNLLALKALEADYSGCVKCVYIDPPYNTGSAFEQYEDGIEHSLWLSLMAERLELLRRLLRPDGSIWMSLDDNEAHYAKVLGDEIFGRDCFIADISWRKRDGPPNDRVIGSVHEHVLVWGRSKVATSRKTVAEEAFNLMPRTDKANSQYKVFAEPEGDDERGPFRKIDTTANAKGGRYVESLNYPLINPYTKEEVWPRKGTCWRHSQEEMARLQNEKRLYWGVKGTAKTPMRKLFLSEAKSGMSAPTIWNDCGLNQHASAEMEKLFGEKAAFETPKPEALLERIVRIASNPGEIVLDSFAGSGTTGAVAHKLRRRWIMVEIHDHCHTRIRPRLIQVVEGVDEGGITRAAEWAGGGGFRYYELAPSLLQKDNYNNWIINEEYNAAMLAEALCKIEGFEYDPSPEIYWQQGRSTETDYIFVTTRFMTIDMLQQLSDEVGPDRSLLVLCKAHRAGNREWPNLTVKKIPKAVLAKCEWGKDDYSLEIKQLPVAEDDPDDIEPAPQVEPKANGAVKKRRRKAAAVVGGSLFSGEDADEESD